MSDIANSLSPEVHIWEGSCDVRRHFASTTDRWVLGVSLIAGIVLLLFGGRRFLAFGDGRAGIADRCRGHLVLRTPIRRRPGAAVAFPT